MSFRRPNVIAFTETLLSDNHADNLIQSYANFYTIYRCDRNSRGGGAAIFVHDSLHSSHMCNINVQSIESV